MANAERGVALMKGKPEGLPTLGKAVGSAGEFLKHHWVGLGLLAVGIIGLRWLWNKSGKKD